MRNKLLLLTALACALMPLSSYAKGKTSNSAYTGTINGHEYVDLGLSVKWATLNLGAYSDKFFGKYFAWGETNMKLDYFEGNSKTFEKSMGDIAGDANYDAARAIWGGTWRLPTASEMNELITKCNWTVTTLRGGLMVYKVTGPNGNSITFPMAGYRYGADLYNNGMYRNGVFGYYWTSTPDENDTQRAYCLFIDGQGFDNRFVYCYSFGRYGGFSIRPVSD